MRAVFYMRVSTNDQTVENQRRELLMAAKRNGWEVLGEYKDEGISGAKGRDGRPGFDAMLKDAARGRFDVIMVWHIDRLGRSLFDLLRMMMDLHEAKVGLKVLQQDIDTTTPAGRAMFQMMGVFAEFEREMNRSRVVSGLARARAQGRVGGKKPMEATNPEVYEAVVGALKDQPNAWQAFVAVHERFPKLAATTVYAIQKRLREKEDRLCTS